MIGVRRTLLLDELVHWGGDVNWDDVEWWRRLDDMTLENKNEDESESGSSKNTKNEQQQ